MTLKRIFYDNFIFYWIFILISSQIWQELLQLSERYSFLRIFQKHLS